jgi:hypothetical protein
VLRIKTLKFLIFQYRFDILLEIRLSGVAEQEYAGLYGKSQIKVIVARFLPDHVKLNTWGII